MDVCRYAVSMVVLSVVPLFAAASTTSAADTVQLTELLTSPERYTFRPVRVQGTVSDLRTESFINPTMRRVGCNQYFTLDDGTGALEAMYLTLCPPAASIVHNGDRVILEASFERAPGTRGRLNVQTVRKP